MREASQCAVICATGRCNRHHNGTFKYALLPLANTQQIEVENNLKDVTTETGKTFGAEVSFLVEGLAPFAGKGVGEKMSIPFDFLERGLFEVVAQIAQAPDYGDYVATLDGKKNQPDADKLEAPRDRETCGGSDSQL